MDLYPYPISLPTSTLTLVVIDALRGKIPDVKLAAHCVWHMTGFGLGTWEGETTPFTAVAPLTRAEAADLLAAKTSIKAGPGVAVGLDLNTLLRIMPLLLELLRELLSRQVS